MNIQLYPDWRLVRRLHPSHVLARHRARAADRRARKAFARLDRHLLEDIGLLPDRTEAPVQGPVSPEHPLLGRWG